MLPVPVPMLAVSGRPPDDLGRWAIEMKWDGVRAVVRCDEKTCRFSSRNARDISGSYPDLVDALTAAADGRKLVIDGEIVAPDPKTGAPSFHRLQRRMHVVAPKPALISEIPVEFYVFDLLELDGTSIMTSSYRERRRQLTELDLAAGPTRTPPVWTDVDAASMIELAEQHHLEGIVTKRLDSTYQPGTRSPLWIKTPLRKTTEAIVAGWLPGSGKFQQTFGSLVLAAHDDAGRLVHIGNVGTGFSFHDRRTLHAQLKDLARKDIPLDLPPPRAAVPDVRWVDPRLVADIEFREITGGRLRHPSWRGLRTDKTPDEIGVP